VRRTATGSGRIAESSLIDRDLAAHFSIVILEHGDPRILPRNVRVSRECDEVMLREIQALSGAVLPPASSNCGIPLHFGSARDEYLAATTAAALFDLSDRTLLELSGTDRARFLHSFCTNDVKRLTAGAGCEAFVPNVKGRVIGHVWIDATDSYLWLDSDPGSAERLVAHLERYVINEDVTIADRTADWAELLVTGPEAADRLVRLGIDVARLGNLEHIVTELCGVPARLRRWDVGPHRGYALFITRERVADCWDCLRNANFHPAGSDTWTALRIEAGLPVFGVDISDENLAQEVGRTKAAISFNKGCYLGQEPIARIDALGHVNRELRSLLVAGEIVPAPGSRVFADAAVSSTVGTMTSSAFSYGCNSPVAMALLRAQASTCGGQVFIESSGSAVVATVFWHPTQ
jgi:tRNA-modifying protein YgfZ